MASTFENNLRLEEIGTGEQSGTWGTKTNVNLELITDGFSYSSTGEAIANASTHTITMADGVADEFRSLYLKCTGGGQACTVTLAPNTLSKVWIIENTTSATLTFSQGSGANVAILAGQVKVIATDGQGSGAAVFDLMQDLAVPDLFVDDDLTLQSDGAVLNFGADSDISLTHTADTSLTLGGAGSTTGLLINNTATDGDPFLAFALSGTQVFTMGVDDGDGDKFKIGTTAIGTNTRLTIDSSGNATFSGTVTATGTSVFASLDISGDIDVDGTTNLDAVDIDGAVQLDGTLTVGVDDTGYDVKFFGASASHFLLWDESADELVLAADSKLSFNDAAGGENIVASADGHLEVNAGTTLDVTAPTVQINASSVFDVNGNIDVSGTYTGGGLMTTGGNIVIPNTGNIGSAGDTDAIAIAADGVVTLTQKLIGTELDISGDIDVDGTTNLDVVDIDGVTTIDLADGVAPNLYALTVKNREIDNDQSYGLLIHAGTTNTDRALVINDHDGSNALFYVHGNGNVALGMTNATEKFTVVNSSSGIVGRFTNNSNQTLDLGVISGTGSAGGVSFNNANSGYLSFQSGGTEAMRIDSSGNVGIACVPNSSSSGVNGLSVGDGGSVPLGSLVSDGASNTETRLGHAYYHDGSDFKYETASVGVAIYQQLGNNAGAQHIWFSNAGGSEDATFTPTERMRIDSNGQIGISGSTTAFDTTGAVNGLQLYYETDSGLATIGSYGGSTGATALTFHTNSGTSASEERMRIKSTGEILHTLPSEDTTFAAGTDSTWNRFEIFQDRGAANTASGIAFRSQSGTAPAGIVGVALNTTGGREELAFITSTGNASSEAMRIDENGNVGIGEDSPDADLHLGAASPHIDIGPSTGNRGKVGFDSNNVYIGSTSGTGEIYFKNNIGSTDAPHSSGDTKMVITDDGVGIGTSSPNSLLHLAVDSGAGSPTINLERTDTSVSSTNTIGNIIFTAGEDGSEETVAQISAIAEENFTSTSSATGIQFKTTASGNTSSTDAMRIDSNGNVGIGTTNPIGDLSIVDSSTGSGIEIQPEVTTDTNRITNFDRVETAYKKFRLDASEHAFYISGTERMRIRSTGDAGIGTGGDFTYDDITGSGAGLVIGSSSVSSAGIAIRTGTSGTSRIYFADNSGSADARKAGSIEFDHSTDDMTIQAEDDLRLYAKEDFVMRGGTYTFDNADGSSEYARIDSSGNVGIADNDPPSRLTVLGDNAAAPASNGAGINGIQVTRTTSSSENLYIYTAGNFTGWSGSAYSARIEGFGLNALEIGNRGEKPVVFATNNTERMRVDSGGAVGINDTDPSSYPANTQTGSATNAGQFRIGGSVGAICASGTGNELAYTRSGLNYISSPNGGFRIRAGSSGGVTLSDAATSWTSASDERLKTLTGDIENAIDKVKTLRTKMGHYNDDSQKVLHPFLIAQDVKAVLPEAVSVIENDPNVEDKTGVTDKLYLSYTDVIPLLTAALKESIAKNEALEARIAALEGA